jgi:hypothetical protein
MLLFLLVTSTLSEPNDILRQQEFDCSRINVASFTRSCVENAQTQNPVPGRNNALTGQPAQPATPEQAAEVCKLVAQFHSSYPHGLSKKDPEKMCKTWLNGQLQGNSDNLPGLAEPEFNVPGLTAGMVKRMASVQCTLWYGVDGITCRRRGAEIEVGAGSYGSEETFNLAAKVVIVGLLSMALGFASGKLSQKKMLTPNTYEALSTV